MAVDPEPGGPLDPGPTTGEQLRGTFSALLVGIAGLIGGQAIGLGFAIAVLSLFFAADPSFVVVSGLSTVGFGLGLAVVAGVYLYVRDHGWSYIDLSIPSLRDIGWTVGGFLALLAASAAISILFSQLGVSTETSSIQREVQQLGTPEVILVFIPLSWLVIGPGEELVYRNIVQKSLYEYFSRRAAIAVASVIFALVHIPQYANLQDFSILSTTSTLLLIFSLALILGYTYERTENLLVPALIHGTFNAFSFYSIYVRITTDAAPAVI